MSVEIIIPIAAVILILLVSSWLFKVVKASIKTMLTIAAILIALQIVYGINSNQIIQEIGHIIEQIKQMVLSQI